MESMTEPLPLSGHYTAFKSMADGSFRITIDLLDKYPPREIMERLGRPGKGQMLAVIAINTDAIAKAPAEEKPTKPKRNWDEVSRVEQAGVLCRDDKFDDFVRDVFPDSYRIHEEAAGFVRAYCGVKSRADLDTDRNASARWDNLVQDYFDWKGQQRVEAQAAEYQR